MTTGGTRPRSLAGLLRPFHALPDKITAVVAETDGLRIGMAWPFPVRLAVIADPALAREVLTRPSGFVQGRGIAALRRVLRDGLLTSEEPLHRRQRRLVQPAFHPAQLRLYAADMVRAAGRRSDQWRSEVGDGGQATVDVAQEMSSLTLDVVGRTLFGSDLSQVAPVVATATDRLLEIFPRAVRPLGELESRLPTRMRRVFEQETAELDRVVERVVAARRAGEQTGPGSTPVDEQGTHPDVLSILLSVRDEETGEPMAPGLVRDEVLTLLLAGHETTAVALTWAFYELSRHPELRAWLEEELADPATEQALATADWQRLHRTRAVVAETLRLWPPAYLTSRVATQPTQLGGVEIPSRTVCLISPYALHRDPRSWGQDAAVWRPQRWLTADGTYDDAAPGHPRGAYLPFGAGSRMCIGAAFAVSESVLLLATLAKDWHLDVPAGYDPGRQPAVTLRALRAVPARLTPRVGALSRA